MEENVSDTVWATLAFAGLITPVVIVLGYPEFFYSPNEHRVLAWFIAMMLLIFVGIALSPRE